MTTSSIADVILIAKDYCQIAINIVQRYVNERFIGKLFWRSMKIDFKDWTKEHGNTLNGKIWNKILTYCIPRGVWIKDSDN